MELIKSELLEFEEEVLARLHLALSRLYRDSDPELALHHLGKLPDSISGFRVLSKHDDDPEKKLPKYVGKLALKYKIDLAHIKKSPKLFQEALDMAEK